MKYFVLVLALSLAGCSQADANTDYVHMDSDLKALKADFNAASDQVRLVFIVGPT